MSRWYTKYKIHKVCKSHPSAISEATSFAYTFLEILYAYANKYILKDIVSWPSTIAHTESYQWISLLPSLGKDRKWEWDIQYIETQSAKLCESIF